MSSGATGPKALFCRTCSKATTPGGRFCAFCGRSLVGRPSRDESAQDLAEDVTSDLDGPDSIVETVVNSAAIEEFEPATQAQALIVGELPLQDDLASKVQTLRAMAPTGRGKEPLRDVVLYAPSDVARKLSSTAIPRRARWAEEELLTPYERHLLAQIDGESSLDSLRARSRLSAGDLMASILTLLDRGLISVTDPSDPATLPGSGEQAATLRPASDEPWLRAPTLPNLDLESTERPDEVPARTFFDAAMRDEASGARISARANLQLAVSLAPSNAQFREELQRLEAVELRDLAGRPAGSGATILIEEALAAEAAGDVARAIGLLERSMVEHEQPAAMNHLAVILATHQREYERARALLEMAIEREPENATYGHNLFKVLEAIARRDGTEEGLKRSLTDRVTSLWEWIRGRPAGSP